jgi:O-acetyl-ADP-ribose deacetylase (regulator of RNase III)
MKINKAYGDIINVARLMARKHKAEVFIPHVCNTVGTMGAGVALRLASTFPQIVHNYRNACTSSSGKLLGQTFVEFAEPHIYVVNMVAQEGLRKPQMELPPIRYTALVACMQDVLREVLSHADMGVPTRIVCPMFGSGLAGGYWPVIQQLIAEIWSANLISVTVVEYTENHQ